MKRLLLILSIILCSLTAFAQNYTKKWNNILKRYEYYQGNTMVGVEVYNSILRQWEYTATNQPKIGTKQEWEVYTPYDTRGLGNIIQQKQAAYDYNRAAIQQAVNHFKEVMNDVEDSNEGFTKEQNANLNRFIAWLNEVTRGDLSNNTLTSNIILSVQNKTKEMMKWAEWRYNPYTGKPIN